MPHDTVLLARDPFARTELQRSLIHPDHRSAPCNNCGTPHAKFQYAEMPDEAPRLTRWSRPFCGVDCFRSYSS
jgi:hypothetical protein